jgi:hypothetical protein
LPKFAALCTIIEAGLGAGALPEGAARCFVAAMRLRMMRLTGAWTKRSRYVCMRDYELLPSIARKLVDHLTGGNDTLVR